ncbi:MAG: hypothetical protein RR022_04725 [Angelakisella sp.]
MSYMICSQTGAPKMDTLPAYKVVDYPLEQRDYKPYAKVRLCMTPTELVLELWSYEMVPCKESRMQAVFTTRNSQNQIFVENWSDGTLRCFVRSPAGDRPLSVHSHTIDNEDHLGYYWGIRAYLPRTTIEELLGSGVTAVGSVLLGNIYKLSDNSEKPHKGSLYPAAFATGQEYALASMGEFEIVNY